MDITFLPDNSIDISSNFQGITTPIRHLYQEIEKRGWTVQKVVFKNNQFSAIAKNPYGETIEKVGPDDATAVGALLMAVMRREFIRHSPHIGAWSTDWVGQIQQIAKAYAEAPVYDPKAAPAWKELADDCVHRQSVLVTQIDIEITNDPVPYTTLDELLEDVKKKQHYLVSRADTEHPVWTRDQVIAFRTCHDILGHVAAGTDYSWEGENRATQAMMPMLSPSAQHALFTETIGQSAYAALYRALAPAKVAFLEEHLQDAQEAENAPGHTGIHPSQSLVPASLPEIEPKTSGAIQDPNEGWDPKVDPDPNNAYLMYGDPLDYQGVVENARKINTNWSGLTRPDGTPDISRMRQAIVNAFRAVLLSPQKNLKWNAIHYQDLIDIPYDQEDPKVYWDRLEGRREAWNQARGRAPGAHKIFWQPLQDFYRYIKAQNPNLPDNQVYEKADQEVLHMRMEEEQRILEDSKKDWNADELERKIDQAISKRLKNIANPKFNLKLDRPLNTQKLFEAKTANVEFYSDHDIHKGTITQDGKVYIWPAYLTDEDYEPTHTDVSMQHDILGKDFVIDNGTVIYQPAAAEPYLGLSPEFVEWVNTPLTPDERVKIWEATDRQVRFPKEPKESSQTDLLTGEEAGYYGAFMGTHLKSIAKISEYADILLGAALKDIREHNGSGHHFRATTLSLDIPGVGPKVASFAWLLLQPLTSQLSVIDSHMAEVLGHDADKDMNNRDYFKFERELAAGKDAAGYNTMPLGLFHWGMWDYKRTGPGSHQDHGALKVLDPVPHHNIDWNARAIYPGKWESPDWWDATQPYRDQAAQAFDDVIGSKYPQSQIPYKEEPAMVTSATKKDLDWVIKTYDDLAKQLHDNGTLGWNGWACHTGANMLDYLCEKAGINSIVSTGRYWHDTPEDYARTIGEDPAEATHRDEYHNWVYVSDPTVGSYILDPNGEERGEPRIQDDNNPKYEPREGWDMEKDGVWSPEDLDWRQARSWDKQLDAGIRSLEGKTSSVKPEFHVALQVPLDVREKIAKWVGTLDWPEDAKLESPSDYHLTVMFAPWGWDDKAHHDWIKARSSSQFPFSNPKLELFTGGESAVVLYFPEAKECKEWATALLDEAEERELDVNRFDGFKPHITIAYASELPKGKALDLSFRSGPTYVSTPRDYPDQLPFLEKVASQEPTPWFIDDNDDVVEGEPGTSLMNHLRQHYGLSPEEVWKLELEAGKR